MTFAEHSSNLLIIIIGLGMTELLISSAKLLKEYKRVVFFLPQVLIVVFIFLYFIVNFFDTYYLLAKVSHPRLIDFVAVGFPPLAGVYTSFIVFPRIPDEGVIDLRKHYFEFVRMGLSFGLFVAIFRLSRNAWLYDESLLLAKNVMEAILIPIYLVAYHRADWLHKIGSVILLSIMMVLIYVYSTMW